MKKVMLAALVAFGVGLGGASATNAAPADGIAVSQAAQVISPMTKAVVCAMRRVCGPRGCVSRRVCA
jgi:hypothetical protein